MKTSLIQRFACATPDRRADAGVEDALRMASAWSEELPALLAAIERPEPSRDDPIAAIENACGEHLSCICVTRIADAVLHLYRA